MSDLRLGDRDLTSSQSRLSGETLVADMDSDKVPFRAAEIVPILTMRLSPGKGYGLFAVGKLGKGRCLLQEVPILVIQQAAIYVDDVTVRVERLCKRDRRAYEALANSFLDRPKWLGIFATNSLPMGSYKRGALICLQASRVNNSCNPNCVAAWNERRQCITLHAIRDILAEEELTIAYTELAPSEPRRRHLKREYNFDCICDWCQLPKDTQRTLDFQIAKIQRTWTDAEDGFKRRQRSRQLLRRLHKASVFLEKEGIDGLPIERTCHDAFVIAAGHASGTKAKEFAGKTYEARKLYLGEDHFDTNLMKTLWVDPTIYKGWGEYLAWKFPLPPCTRCCHRDQKPDPMFPMDDENDD